MINYKKVIFFIIPFFILLSSLNCMEKEIQESLEIHDTPQSQIIIFSQNLDYIVVDEFSLAYSEPLANMLYERKKQATKHHTIYNNNVISTDLATYQLHCLKGIITAAQLADSTTPTYFFNFTQTEKRLIKEFKILNLYNAIDEIDKEEIEQMDYQEKQRTASLQQKMMQFLHRNPQTYTLPSNTIKPKLTRSQATLCTLLTFGFHPPEQQINTQFIEAEGAFRSYGTLILTAAAHGDIRLLKKIITPLPHTLRTYHSYFNGHKTFDINALRTKKGDSPLSLAVKMEALQMVKYLVEECGADHLWTDEKENSLLHLAATNNSYNANLLRYLVAYCNLDPLKQNINGYTPLHKAAKNARLSSASVNYFIQECKIDPLMTTLHRMHCLDLAAFAGNFFMVKHLINNHKMDPNARNSGCSTLFYTVAANKTKIAKFLVSHGANFKIKNSNGSGMSSFELARSCGDNAHKILKFFVNTLYKEALEENPECPICFTNFKDYKRRHISFTPCCYKFICIEDSKNITDKCPLCRARLINGYITL